MMNFTRRARLLSIVFLPLAGVACGDDGGAGGGTATGSSGSGSGTASGTATGTSGTATGTSGTATGTSGSTTGTTGMTDTGTSTGTGGSTGGGVCGNGMPEPGEECDDGNAVDDDACSNACVAATCSDTTQNAGETDVDCGGPCGSSCADGQMCVAATDCASAECSMDQCTCSPWTVQFGTDQLDAAAGITVSSTGDVYVAGWTTGTFPNQAQFGQYDLFAARYDATGNPAWVRQLGTAQDDFAYAAALDPAGNLVVVGSSEGDLGGQSNAGNHDIAVVKLSPNGDTVWTRLFGSTDYDAGTAVAMAPDGMVYVAGYTWGAFPGQSSSGNSDAVLLQLDGDGDLQWTYQFGTSGTDFAYAVAPTSTGGAVVAGQASGGLNGQPALGGSDGFVVRVADDGTPKWTRLVGSASDDSARAVTTTANDSVYVAGDTTGTVGNDPKPGGDDTFLVKLDADGSEQWARMIGTSVDDYATGVTTDSQGGAVISGATLGSFPTYTNQGGEDLFAVHYDAAGSPVWTRQVGSAGYDSTPVVATDGAGQVYLAGTTNGDLGGGGLLGGQDAFLLRMCE